MTTSEKIAFASVVVSALSALGSLGAVIVALWGDRIRARFFPIALELDIASRTGELTQQRRTWIDTTGVQKERVADARYYHVRVRNVGRFPPAHDVQVMIIRIETRGPDGRPQHAWNGALPLTWKHPELHPVARTVGPRADAEVDLFFVLEGKPIELTPMIVPNNFPARHAPADGPVWITLQAYATEGRSEPLRVEIAWDGKWHLGENEMGRHLRITTEPQLIRELDKTSRL